MSRCNRQENIGTHVHAVISYLGFLLSSQRIWRKLKREMNGHEKPMC